MARTYIYASNFLNNDANIRNICQIKNINKYCIWWIYCCISKYISALTLSCCIDVYQAKRIKETEKIDEQISLYRFRNTRNSVRWMVICFILYLFCIVEMKPKKYLTKMCTNRISDEQLNTVPHKNQQQRVTNGNKVVFDSVFFLHSTRRCIVGNKILFHICLFCSFFVWLDSVYASATCSFVFMPSI